MSGCSPVNMEAFRCGLPEVGALRCDRCGDLDVLAGSLALDVDDVRARLTDGHAGRCVMCGHGLLRPVHPEVASQDREEEA